ncbi:MAG: hypothetical protein JNJ40_10920 [Bacteroidia bacterium]|nr:hypothetical protein [Bacteroidia bacterium]
MKSVNFQRNKALIRVVNEQKVKKQRNWDRILYLGLLGLFLVFVIYYLVTKYLFIHAYGHVIIESTRIRLTDDARIIEFYVKEGDRIEQNDTLFSYALDRDDDISGNSSYAQSVNIGSIEGGSRDDWWVKEIYALKKKIALNNIEISENENLISGYKKEIKRISNEVILDVLPKTRLEYIQNEMVNLHVQNKKLEKENKELNSLMKSLGPSKKTRKINGVNIRTKKGGGGAGDKQGVQRLDFSEELLTQAKYFRSPVNGIATRIYIHTYETALKSEEIMAVHEGEPAYIKAYFEQEDLRHFKEGDLFSIEFPDGTVSKGILKRFYIATYTLPEEFQKKYEPTTRSIAADIYPIDSLEIKKWKTFYKMSVDISKLKL